MDLDYLLNSFSLFLLYFYNTPINITNFNILKYIKKIFNGDKRIALKKLIKNMNSLNTNLLNL